MRTQTHHPHSGLELPRARHVGDAQPFVWLWRGWQDLRANPLPSLAYGLLFGLGGDLILLAALGQPHLLSAALSGFLLVAPMLAVGLYELSRARAADLRLGFIDSLWGVRRNLASLSLFGLLLALLALFWERLSAILFALFGDTSQTDALNFMTAALMNTAHWPLLLAWLLAGGLLAGLVFACGVVAVPMLLDRPETDPISAMLASLACVARNPRPLLIWAALIVVLVLLGFATLLFGLVLFMPLLGHASWHAYRDLVE
ncbi:MAG: DUF2189 domain-containing protein [Azovibrio sp.]|nr:DUF2189 domain-containing protein [Azovibrio sp.]